MFLDDAAPEELLIVVSVSPLGLGPSDRRSESIGAGTELVS